METCKEPAVHTVTQPITTTRTVKAKATPDTLDPETLARAAALQAHLPYRLIALLCTLTLLVCHHMYHTHTRVRVSALAQEEMHNNRQTEQLWDAFSAHRERVTQLIVEQADGT